MCVGFKSFFLLFRLRLAKEIGLNCAHVGAWAADKGFGTGGNGWEMITKEWMNEK